jgi:glycosyltransferase involved in cell wall biosynthesis
MRRFVRDPALAETMGQAARARFLAKFTAQEMARSYDALYRELATASR